VTPGFDFPFLISEEGARIGGSGGHGHGGRRRPRATPVGAARRESLRGRREREERGLLSPAHLGRMRLEEVARLGPVKGRRWRAWRRRRWKGKEAAGGGSGYEARGRCEGPLYRASEAVEVGQGSGDVNGGAVLGSPA
jgi:hypothetical protein